MRKPVIKFATSILCFSTLTLNKKTVILTVLVMLVITVLSSLTQTSVIPMGMVLAISVILILIMTIRLVSATLSCSGWYLVQPILMQTLMETVLLVSAISQSSEHSLVVILGLRDSLPSNEHESAVTDINSIYLS